MRLKEREDDGVLQWRLCCLGEVEVTRFRLEKMKLSFVSGIVCYVISKCLDGD